MKTFLHTIKYKCSQFYGHVLCCNSWKEFLLLTAYFSQNSAGTGTVLIEVM